MTSNQAFFHGQLDGRFATQSQVTGADVDAILTMMENAGMAIDWLGDIERRLRGNSAPVPQGRGAVLPFRDSAAPIEKPHAPSRRKEGA